MSSSLIRTAARASLLLGLFVVLSACASSKPETPATIAALSPAEHSLQRAQALLQFTPDSLIEQPERIFFESDQPRAVTLTDADLPDAAHVTMRGAAYESGARIELQLETTVPSLRYLTPTPFVVLRGRHAYAVRGTAWRTLTERRSVSIYPADAVRLAASNAPAVLVNGQFLKLPAETQQDLRSALAALPADSPLDAGAVRDGGMTTDAVRTLPRLADGLSVASLHRRVRYPKQATREGHFGRVMVTFTVLPDGTVANQRVVESVHPLLDAEAVRVAGTVTYHPATLNGWPIASEISLPISFQPVQRATARVR